MRTLYNARNGNFCFRGFSVTFIKVILYSKILVSHLKSNVSFVSTSESESLLIVAPFCIKVMLSISF